MSEPTAPRRWTPAQMPDLTGRRALVTGAAAGLGFQTALALARGGARVIVADRNAAGGISAVARINQAAGDGAAQFRALDLARLDDIRDFAESIVREPGALDVLVNNAGILPPAQRAVTADGFELKLGISYLGHFALTAGLLEALRRSDAPRVVSVTSLVHRHGRIHFDDLQLERRYGAQRAYNQAKLACLVFALELDRRARAAGNGLCSVAAHPGVARTGLGDSRRHQPRRGLRDLLELAAMDAMMKWVGQSAERGAWPILYAATAREVRGGGFYAPGGFGEFAGHPRAARPSAAALEAGPRLWTLSEQLTGATWQL